MRDRRFPVFAALLALLLAPAVVTAQADKKSGAADPAMEAMMKAATPGDAHKALARYAGDWTYKMKMWMAPDVPAIESGGTMHAEPILGGRYVQSVYKGEFMGQPFEGRGTEGYDNTAKQYVGTWVDNAGTGIMNSTGTADSGGKVYNWTSEMLDPVTGKKIGTKQVVTWLDDKNFKMEMYMVDPGSGQSTKTMEIVSKKK